MRAAQLMQTGLGPDGLALQEIPRPEPAGDEVLIEVHAVSASKLELEQTMAGIGLGRAATLPRTLGMDPAGVVIAQGPGVAADLVGRRVAVKPNLVCGHCRHCRAAQEADCDAQQQLGVHRDGGLAEYVTVPARQAFSIPDGLDFVTAAAGVHTIAVACHMLAAAGPVGSGDAVLVLGASGAVGSAVAQLALHAGADVIAAASDLSRLDEAIGATTGPAAVTAVAYRDVPAFVEQLRRLAPAGVTAVLDSTGRGDLVGAAVDLLGWGGALVTCASQPGQQIIVDQAALYRRRRRLIGVGASDFADVRRALAHMAADRVRPRIAGRFPLDAAPDAYRALADRSRSGKIMVTLTGEDRKPEPEHLR